MWSGSACDACRSSAVPPDIRRAIVRWRPGSGRWPLIVADASCPAAALDHAQATANSRCRPLHPSVLQMARMLAWMDPRHDHGRPEERMKISRRRMLQLGLSGGALLALPQIAKS